MVRNAAFMTRAHLQGKPRVAVEAQFRGLTLVALHCARAILGLILRQATALKVPEDLSLFVFTQKSLGYSSR